jgi:exopolyphosphatase/pppGpp-phosphohydrolase
LQQRINNYAKDMATSGSVEDIKRMEEEISQSRYNIEVLKGQRLKNEEIEKMADSVIEVVNLISQEMKPHN